VKVTPTQIPDVLLIEPEVFHDARGFFMESYHQERLARAGIEHVFVQDNHARSVQHTLRGLHYQRNPGQAKLLRVTRGAVWDVAVDIRPASPTLGQWVGTELSAESHAMLLVPVGFAHGYLALSDVVEVQYKCTSYYDAVEERGIAYNDPELAIAWPVEDPILSERDRNNPSFREVFDGNERS